MQKRKQKKLEATIEYKREDTNGEQTENVIELNVLVKNFLSSARERTKKQVLSWYMSATT